MIMIFVRTKNFLITERKFLSAIRGQSEAQHSHAGDEKAGDDQVGEVVHRPPPDLDGEGDVQVGLRAALVDHLISNCGDSWGGRELVSFMIFWSLVVGLSC